MVRSQRSRGTYESRIVRVTLVIGTLTVLTASAVALVNTSRLASEKSKLRDSLAVEVVEERISGALRQAETLSTDIGVLLAGAGRSESATVEIEDVLRQSRGVIDLGYVVRPDGSVIASYAPEPGVRVTSLEAYRQARSGIDGYVTSPSSDGSSGELWFTRAVLRGSTPRLVIVRLDATVIEDALRSVTASGAMRMAAVVDSGRVFIGDQSGASLPVERMSWTPTTRNSGVASLRGDDGVMMRGQYQDVRGFPGLDWRVVVIEPAQPVAVETLRAVAPTLSVLTVGGLLALAAAIGVARRLAKPLRELERAARNAAAGSYVKQLTVSRDDEIGRVAQAFNLVALRLNALQDLSQLLASASQIDRVLDRILSAMGHILGPGAAAIYLLNDEGTTLYPVRTRGMDLSGAVPVELNPTSWLARTLASSDPGDMATEPMRLREELPGLEGSHSHALAAPLAVGLELLGVVVVLRDDAAPVTDAELEMVRTFSAQAAIAVKNSQLFEAESTARLAAETLRTVTEELVRPRGLEDALRAVEIIVSDALSAEMVGIVLIDPTEFGLRPAERSAREGDILDCATEALRLGLGDPVSMPVGTLAAADRILRALDAKELVVAPISLDEAYGAIMVAALAESGRPSGSLTLVRALADEIALALENAYLYERALSRAANLETIFRISQAVGSSLQVNVVLNRVLDVVQKILSADAVALLSYDARKQELSTAMARGSVPASVLHLSLGPGEDLPGKVFDSGEPVAVHDLRPGMGGIAGSVAEHDLHSLLAVPLLARGRSIGVLMVFSEIASVFNSEDLSMLQTFAAQAALALDTARLYSREHDMASVLLQSLVPDALPVFDELVTDSVYAPAGGDVEIGGDYYDLIRGRDDSIWLSIADVCGKGVVAATKTSMIKYAVRALVAAGLTPAAVATEVNTMISDTGEVSDIVTLWLGRYDPGLRSLVWANGGHPPGLLKRMDGRMERLDTTGPLMGVSRDVKYGECETPLAEGDCILLYTDGVTEARLGKTFFGEERVERFLATCDSADHAASGLLDEVRQFVHGQPLRDDVAVLAVGARRNRGSSADAQVAETT